MNEPRPPIIPNFSSQPTTTPPVFAGELNTVATPPPVAKPPLTGAPPVFQNGMLVTNTVHQPVELNKNETKTGTTKLNDGGAVSSIEKNKKENVLKPKKETVLNSTIVVFVVALVTLVGLGIAYFLTWQKGRTENAALTASVNQKNQQIANLNNLLTQANDLRLTQQKLPVYVDSNGHFSFLQEIPGLTVTKDDATGIVNLYYGQADADMLLSGFKMTIKENVVNNGESIDEIAEKAWVAVTGNASFDAAAAKSKNGWRDESPILSDVVGYSFVAMVDDKEQYFYFLQRDYLDNKNYLEINFEIAATTRSEYDNYEGVATKQVLESLEIYR